MGVISWLMNQLDELDMDGEDAGSANSPTPGQSSREVSFPEFQGVRSPHLEQELSNFIGELEAGPDREYGDWVLRSLRNEGVEPPAMPEDVLRIQRLLSSPDCDVAALGAAISRDPTIAGRFVAIANSPLYARADRVRNVEDAVVRIGLRQTSMIVMAIVSRTKLFRAPGFEAEAKALHRHCLAAAVCAQILARRARLDDGHAFMGGLLHDIGRIWLMGISANLHRSSRGSRTVRAETLGLLSERFHPAFGAIVAEEWGFEEDLVEALMLHHNPLEGSPPETVRGSIVGLTYAIAAAHLMAQAIEDPDRPKNPALAESLEFLGIEPDASLQRECTDAFIAFEQNTA